MAKKTFHPALPLTLTPEAIASHTPFRFRPKPKTVNKLLVGYIRLRKEKIKQTLADSLTPTVKKRLNQTTKRLVQIVHREAKKAQENYEQNPTLSKNHLQKVGTTLVNLIALCNAFLEKYGEELEAGEEKAIQNKRDAWYEKLREIPKKMKGPKKTPWV